MIQSVLDNDLYKVSMAYLYMKQFPYAKGKFQFKDRDNDTYTKEFVEDLKQELWKTNSLKLSKDELKWCKKNITYIPPFFWEWLSSFRYNPELIDISLDKDKHLSIEITGDIVHASMWEIPLLAIISELWYKYNNMRTKVDDVIDKLEPKIELSNREGILFSDFGTRRRFSSSVQDTVIKYIKKNSLFCTGTSNIFYAKEYGLRPIGTQAHEVFSFVGSQFGYKHANYLLMEKWIDAYDGDLGIALTDTFTSKVFFENFSMKHAKLFDGIRQDSGDPFEFVNQAIERYRQLGIDPSTKTIIFSDSLDFNRALELKNYCNNRIRCAFGIGTNLTNDCGHKPKNIVIKLVKSKMTKNTPWRDCIKLSDVEGKHIGNEDEIYRCKEECGLL